MQTELPAWRRCFSRTWNGFSFNLTSLLRVSKVLKKVSRKKEEKIMVYEIATKGFSEVREPVIDG